MEKAREGAQSICVWVKFLVGLVVVPLEEREREREGHWAGGGRGIFSCVKMIMEVLHQNLSVQGGMC